MYLLFLLYMCVFGFVHAEVRRQLLEFISSLPPCGFQAPVSGPKTWQWSTFACWSTSLSPYLFFLVKTVPQVHAIPCHTMYMVEVQCPGEKRSLVHSAPPLFWPVVWKPFEKLVNYSLPNKGKPSQKPVSFHFICTHAHVNTHVHG